MNKAVVTFVQNKYEPIMAVAIPRLENYANKCGAALEVISLDDDSSDPQMDKFFYVGEKLKNYDQYLIIDIDILVRRDTPSIFDIVGQNRIGIYNEGATLLNAYGHNQDDETVRWAAVALLIKLCKLQPIPYAKHGSWENPFFYFNSGVIVLSQKHREVYSNFTPLEKDNCYANSKKIQCSEQALVNYRLLKCGFPIVSLPNCFNQMAYNRNSDYLDTAYFSHYAGISLEDKIESMQEDHKKWNHWGY
jgi:hypothetical protein